MSQKHCFVATVTLVAALNGHATASSWNADAAGIPTAAGDAASLTIDTAVTGTDNSGGNTYSGGAIRKEHRPHQGRSLRLQHFRLEHLQRQYADCRRFIAIEPDHWRAAGHQLGVAKQHGGQGDADGVLPVETT